MREGRKGRGGYREMEMEMMGNTRDVLIQTFFHIFAQSRRKHP